MCPICMDTPVSVVVASCLHGLCVQCAFQLTVKGRELPSCPFCRWGRARRPLCVPALGLGACCPEFAVGAWDEPVTLGTAMCACVEVRTGGSRMRGSRSSLGFPTQLGPFLPPSLRSPISGFEFKAAESSKGSVSPPKVSKAVPKPPKL